MDLVPKNVLDEEAQRHGYLSLGYTVSTCHLLMPYRGVLKLCRKCSNRGHHPVSLHVSYDA